MLEALAAVAQLALYVGVLCASGAVFAQATLRAEAASARVLNRLARSGAILTILATLGAAIILVFRLGGAFDEATVSAVLMSSVGAAGGMRLAGATLLLLPQGEPGDTFTSGTRLSYAALLVASFLFNGHAAAASFSAGLMAGVHVCLAGWWIASLVAMERSCRTGDVAHTVAIVQRFSRLAVGAVALLSIAGVVMILTLVALPIVRLTPYIGTLATKLAIVLAVIALAAYNKFRLTPRVVSGDVGGIDALRKSIDLELLLIVAVLVATTMLTVVGLDTVEPG